MTKLTVFRDLNQSLQGQNALEATTILFSLHDELTESLLSLMTKAQLAILLTSDNKHIRKMAKWRLDILSS